MTYTIFGKKLHIVQICAILVVLTNYKEDLTMLENLLSDVMLLLVVGVGGIVYKGLFPQGLFSTDTRMKIGIVALPFIAIITSVLITYLGVNTSKFFEYLDINRLMLINWRGVSEIAGVLISIALNIGCIEFVKLKIAPILKPIYKNKVTIYLYIASLISILNTVFGVYNYNETVNKFALVVGGINSVYLMSTILVCLYLIYKRRDVEIRYCS